MTFYGTDLTRVHHEDFGALARAAASTLIDLLGICDHRAAPLVDLGCGSGIFAKALSDRGFDVHGFDVSKEMLKVAKKTAPKAKFSLGSAHRANLPSALAITAIGEVLAYADDEPPDLPRTFQRVHEALRPGGLFLFDMPTPGRSQGGYERFVENEKWSMHLAVEEQERVLSRKIILFTKGARGTYTRTAEVHTQALFTATEVLDTLRNVGFRARPLRGYAGFELPSGWSAFVARR